MADQHPGSFGSTKKARQARPKTAKQREEADADDYVDSENDGNLTEGSNASYLYEEGTEEMRQHQDDGFIVSDDHLSSNEGRPRKGKIAKSKKAKAEDAGPKRKGRLMSRAQIKEMENQKKGLGGPTSPEEGREQTPEDWGVEPPKPEVPPPETPAHTAQATATPLKAKRARVKKVGKTGASPATSGDESAPLTKTRRIVAPGATPAENPTPRRSTRKLSAHTDTAVTPATPTPVLRQKPSATKLAAASSTTAPSSTPQTLNRRRSVRLSRGNETATQNDGAK